MASRNWSRVWLVLFVLVGLGLSVAAGVYLYSKWQMEQREALHREEREAAKKRVALTEVEIVNRRIQRPASLYRFTGRVRNKSTQYELSAIQVELTVRDCVEDDCEIVGQGTRKISLSIPPGQSRDFRATPFFRLLGNPLGRFVWSHRVVQTCSNSGLQTLPCNDLFIFSRFAGM